MSYESKYLKYKNKYFRLKNYIQKGGYDIWNYNTVELNRVYELLNYRETRSGEPPIMVYVIKKERENPKTDISSNIHYHEKYTIKHVNSGVEEVIENDMTNYRTGLNWKFREIDPLSGSKDFDKIQIGKKYRLKEKEKDKNITIVDKSKEIRKELQYSGQMGSDMLVTDIIFTYKIIDESNIESTIWCRHSDRNAFVFIEIPQ
jgi:hypothetical protein